MPAHAPGLHLSRAALYAFGATSLALAAACSRTEGEGASDATGTGAVESGEDHGAPSKPDAGGADADQEDGTDDATTAVYGGPPPDQAK
jgi:hypothetical protein